ncbi:hypothetical protein JKJ07_48830 [Actinoplanes sp. LDG1-01]|uniref:Uncharacterized protein n=1 Tax=Paractinoplanes lichenicola TaxID=2802976 RepID=A0ABS1W6M0_9ACTN|nr:hypothetical protein [Actinoplanes lichenicola]MBL7262203.1 hypothetical protein [Actinoplanes lichenicola]
MDGVAQIEVCRQRGQVVRVTVHVVALADLGRAAVPAPVVGDHPIAVVAEEEQPVVLRHPT